MQLTTAPVTAAIAGLLGAAEATSASVDSAFPPDEAGGKKRAARIRDELNTVCACLRHLQRVLDRLDGVPRHRRELVEVRQLAAVLGAGSLVFWHIESALAELESLSGAEGDPDALRNARHQAKADVWEMLRGLQDFGNSVLWISTVLERQASESLSCHDPRLQLLTQLVSSSTFEAHVADSHYSLRTAVSAILGKDNELSRELRALYPDPDPAVAPGQKHQADAGTRVEDSGFQSVVFMALDDADDSNDDDDSDLPTPTSSEFSGPLEGRRADLSDVTSLDAILVPVADLGRLLAGPGSRRSLEVATVSGTGVEFWRPRDSDLVHTSRDADRPSGSCFSAPRPPPPPEGRALSAESVFGSPGVTEAAVLDFFRRAILVSPFARDFTSSSGVASASAGARDKMRLLGRYQFRELCVDMYDELVRRNVHHKTSSTSSTGKAHARTSSHISIIEPVGLHPKRIVARQRLAALSDEQLRGAIAGVLEELEDRSRRLVGGCAPEPETACHGLPGDGASS